MSDEDLTIIGRRIGYSDTPAEIFGISRADRRRHLYAQGKTGSGKSTLLISMIAQDLHRGEGVCFIDPLGHNAETVLSYVPKWRTHEVCYLNVADRERPVGLNILGGHAQDQEHLATTAAVDAFASVWNLSLEHSPQLLDVLGYALAALVAMPGATLLSLPRFLTDKGFRSRMLSLYVTDVAVRAYWQEFGTRSRREQHELTKSVLNKANELCRHPTRARAFKDANDRYSEAFPQAQELETFHVTGAMPTSSREGLVRAFAKASHALITNARCLTEGVDIPLIDCVLFADPKHSTVDIVQAVGRALRTYNGKACGYVIVPVVARGESETELLESEAFGSVLRVLRALAANDERIIEYFRAVAEGRQGKGGIIDITIDEKIAQTIDLTSFASRVEMKVWSRLARLSWRYPGLPVRQHGVAKNAARRGQ
jgi:hypothetical protein